MDNNYTHYKCSITVRQSEERKFEFIVPQHSVDMEGNVDKDILEEITDKFELGELDFGDCDEETFPSSGYAETYVSPTSTSIMIDSGCSYRDEYLKKGNRRSKYQIFVDYGGNELPIFPVFGENK